MDRGRVARTYGEAATIRSANQGGIKVGDATAAFPLGGRRAQPRVLSPGERALDGPEGQYDASRRTVDDIDVDNDLARTRAKLVDKVGADAVARYESAALGNKVGEVKTVISDRAIAELRNKFPDAEIYVMGKAARAHERGTRPKDVTEVEVMLVVPDGTPGTKRAAYEAEAAAMAIPTSESFAKATGKDALPVRATTRTHRDAVGMMKGERGPAYARIDANVPQLDAAHAAELATLGAPRSAEITRRLGTPIVSKLMQGGMTAKQVDQIAQAFHQAQLGGFHAEGLAASSIHELATLGLAARKNLFGRRASRARKRTSCSSR